MSERHSFPVYLINRDRIYTVEGYIEEQSKVYKIGRGYISEENETVFIFQGQWTNDNIEKSNKDIPVFFTGKDINDVIIEFGPTPGINRAFNVDNIVELNIADITSNTTGNEVLYNEEELNDIGMSSERFTPVINTYDNFLKKAIKMAILKKNINIKKLQHKLLSKSGLGNLKSALVGKTNMSTNYFIIWCEALGLNWELTVKSDDSSDPDSFKGTIRYDSKTDTIRYDNK